MPREINRMPYVSNLLQGNQMTRTEQLQKKLKTVESKLEKNRPSVMADGWQTQKFAKKSRKWDILAQRKMELKQQIEELEYSQSLMDTDPFV